MADGGEDRKAEQGEDATKPGDFEKEDDHATALGEEACGRRGADVGVLFVHTPQGFYWSRRPYFVYQQH